MDAIIYYGDTGREQTEVMTLTKRNNKITFSFNENYSPDDKIITDLIDKTAKRPYYYLVKDDGIIDSLSVPTNKYQYTYENQSWYVDWPNDDNISFPIIIT